MRTNTLRTFVPHNYVFENLDKIEIVPSLDHVGRSSWRVLDLISSPSPTNSSQMFVRPWWQRTMITTRPCLFRIVTHSRPWSHPHPHLLPCFRSSDLRPPPPTRHGKVQYDTPTVTPLGTSTTAFTLFSARTPDRTV